MNLNFKEKKLLVSKFNSIAKNIYFAIFLNYSGTKTNKINELRKICKQKNINSYVIKNTLLKRAIKGTKLEFLKSSFSGPVLSILSEKKVDSIIYLLKNFFDKNKSLKIKKVFFNGKEISFYIFNKLAILKNYEQSILYLSIFLKKLCLGKLFQVFSIIHDQKKIKQTN